MLPRVQLLTTGGTIASRPGPMGLTASTAGSVLFSSVEGLASIADVEVEEIIRIGSYQISVEEMAQVALRIRELSQSSDLSGIVVSHGTDTMEESAYLADLLHTGELPVVFTGAQRSAASLDGDGPGNLRDAVRLAAAPAARGIGVVIAMGGRIDAAREATKVHTRALRAFGSFEYGALGEVAGDEVRLYRRTLRRTAFPDALLEPRVVLVRLVAGMDGLFLEAARRAGARGIVLEAFGIGDVTPAVATEAARCVAEGIVVLVVSRCPSGGVAPLYGGAGGGASLARAGVLFGGTLHGPKARILLMLALGAVQRSGRSLEEWLEPHLNL